MTTRPGWLLNASTATPAQTRQDTRLVPIGTYTPASADALTSRGGLIPGPNPCNLSMSGMTATIAIGRGVVQGTSAQGAYPVAVTVAEAKTIANGHATLDRIDTLWLLVLDTLIDSSGSTLARVEYTQGTPNASPVAPTAPASGTAYLRLWDIRVPANASAGNVPNWVGAGLLTDRRTYTAAVGGIIPDGSAAGAYVGQYRDGGTLQRYNGSSWLAELLLGTGGTVSLGDVTLTRPSSGMLQVNGGLQVTGIGGTVRKVKQADEGRNLTTTLASDTDLSGAALAANCAYAVDATIFYSAHQDADLKLQWTGPAGATFTWHGLCLPTGSTGTVASAIYDAQTLASTYQPGGPDATNTPVMVLRVTGTLYTSGTAGTLGFTWAQGSPRAEQTFIRKGSRIDVTRLA